MDGVIMTHFLPLEELLDSKPGGSVEVEVERGGAPIKANVKVGAVAAAGKLGGWRSDCLLGG